MFIPKLKALLKSLYRLLLKKATICLISYINKEVSVMTNLNIFRMILKTRVRWVIFFTQD